MTRDLTSERRGPEKATSIVVFVHGYGSDGADLMGLADPLAPHFPETAFYSPNAPERSTANPMGFQWFPIPWIDGSSEAEATAGLLHAADDLNAFVDTVLAAEGLDPKALALVGFSQGTMISLQIAPRRADPIGAVVGFSGRLMAPDRVTAETVSRPPVLLLHGDQDEVVPPESLPEAAGALAEAGFTVDTHVMPGTGHGISPDGLSKAASFLRTHLP